MTSKIKDYTFQVVGGALLTITMALGGYSVSAATENAKAIASIQSNRFTSQDWHEESVDLDRRLDAIERILIEIRGEMQRLSDRE
jgi:hypothetical protein